MIEIINMNSEKLKIINNLENEISNLKQGVELRVSELKEFHKIIAEKQALLNELYGLPLKRKEAQE